MKKALVIVSFGTTYERARRSIDAVEHALAQAAEGYDVFRAYTSSCLLYTSPSPALRQRIRRKNPRIVYALCGAIPAWRHR